MKKVAIFAEGQTELIFIRNLLLRAVDPAKLSFECFELISHQPYAVPHQYPNPSAEIHFLILNVRGDEAVLSSIKEREKNLIEKSGYDRIIALRDMYCEEYIIRSPGVINNEISELIAKRHNETIGSMAHADRIKLFFAVMEVEAWFLGMHSLFAKIDPVLTVEHIKAKLGIDLIATDPQTQFYKPSDQVDSIFKLCGHEYKKKQGEIESICSKMDSNDFKNAIENSRCLCFNNFCEELLTVGTDVSS